MTPTTLPLPEQLQWFESVTRDGLARAADHLAALIGRRVSMVAPGVALTPLDDVVALVGGPETCAVGVYLQIGGDLTGHMLMILSRAQALILAGDLLGEPEGAVTELGDSEASALAELGNVTTAGFLNTLAERVGARLMPSPPAFAVDMAGALVDGVLAAASGGASHALTIHARFAVDERAVDAVLLVMPDHRSLPTFLTWARTT
ncbi:MAG: chemotaxis protein CheC [Dehalococcoidia bacterium]|nr:chemotaxis protein CheC [Dehalococcoidia bacterium]